jgi:hypothetical protein
MGVYMLLLSKVHTLGGNLTTMLKKQLPTLLDSQINYFLSYGWEYHGNVETIQT